MPPPDSEQFRWFSAQLQPHEPMLRAWLRAHFPAVADVDDVIQEAYLRVLQVQAKQPLEAPKAYLFATARNLVLAQLRHRVVERIEPFTESELAGILDEGADIPAAVAHAQELELLTKAIQSLPPCCRRIFTLRKIYGMRQREVAAELRISEHTVEKQVVIGVRKIGEYFASHDARS